MWLASLAYHGPAGLVPTAEWTPAMRAQAEQELRRALRGAGNPAQERLFRMCATLCLHRGLTPGEARQLSAGWEEAPGGMAGGPLELLWSRGLPARPAALPCVAPVKEPAPDPRLFLTGDCGECEPCQARAEIRRRLEERQRQARPRPALWTVVGGTR